MIIDFIKSWLYYPKIKKYLKSIGVRDEDMYGTRLGYAKIHCKCGKLKDNYNETEEDKSDGWTIVYDKEPIEKRTVK